MKIQSTNYIGALTYPKNFIKTARINKQSPAYVKLMDAIQNTLPEKRKENTLALLLDGDIHYLNYDEIAFHLANETPIGWMIMRDADRLEQEQAQKRGQV